jgi:hypothetical protein
LQHFIIDNQSILNRRLLGVEARTWNCAGSSRSGASRAAVKASSDADDMRLSLFHSKNSRAAVVATKMLLEYRVEYGKRARRTAQSIDRASRHNVARRLEDGDPGAG